MARATVEKEGLPRRAARASRTSRSATARSTSRSGHVASRWRAKAAQPRRRRARPEARRRGGRAARRPRRREGREVPAPMRPRRARPRHVVPGTVRVDHPVRRRRPRRLHDLPRGGARRGLARGRLGRRTARRSEHRHRPGRGLPGAPREARRPPPDGTTKALAKCEKANAAASARPSTAARPRAREGPREGGPRDSVRCTSFAVDGRAEAGNAEDVLARLVEALDAPATGYVGASYP